MSILLEVEDLRVRFRDSRSGAIHAAVDGVSFEIREGETLGLVGESGSGKTTTARAILRTVPSSARKLRFNDTDLQAVNSRRLRSLRRQIQLVPQDPYSSLNPRLKIRRTLTESLRLVPDASGTDVESRVAELLRLVGLEAEHADRYPHEFSGGQRQRIAIARALSTEPSLVICDEPTSSLDVSIQAQILNLLRSIQQAQGISLLFISHDLAVVRHMAHRVGVMYAGKLVELGSTPSVLSAPDHPYTRALLSAVPDVSTGGGPGAKLHKSNAPRFSTEIEPTHGCVYLTACPEAKTPICTNEPSLIGVAPDHQVACHLRAGSTLETRRSDGSISQ